ncbi:MAG: hypothetical protein L3J35_12365 [Bacteroidales bacterium]|nr:hypothetical protein [Bacteroidales bacterium]
MLKKTLLLGLILVTIQLSFGQDVFRKSKNGINIGGGYRTIGVDAYGGNFSFERSVYEIKHFGYVGVALSSDILVTEKIIPSATLRVAYHAGFFRTKVLDIYAGTGLAFADKETSKSTYINPDAFLGFRYVFRHSNFGLFSEMSLYGANYRAGICFVW